MGNKKQKFSIRKLTVGVCSVLLSTLIILPASTSFVANHSVSAESNTLNNGEISSNSDGWTLNEAQTEKDFDDIEISAKEFIKMYPKADYVALEYDIGSHLGSINEIIKNSKSEDEYNTILNFAKTTIDEVKINAIYQDFNATLNEKDAEYTQNINSYSKEVQDAYKARKEESLAKIEEIKSTYESQKNKNIVFERNLKEALRTKDEATLQQVKEDLSILLNESTEYLVSIKNKPSEYINDINSILTMNSNPMIDNDDSQPDNSTDDVMPENNVILHEMIDNKVVTVEFKSNDSIKYRLNVKDVTDEHKSLVMSKLKSKNVEVMVLDLMLVNSENNSEVNSRTKRSVTITLDQSYMNKPVKIYFLNDETGELTMLNSTFENNMLTFMTDHFSKYTIVVENTSVDNNIDNNIDNNMNDNVDNNVENNMDDNVDNNVENNMDDNVDNNVENNMDDNVDNNVENNMDDNVDNNVENNMDDTSNKIMPNTGVTVLSSLFGALSLTSLAVVAVSIKNKNK